MATRPATTVNGGETKRWKLLCRGDVRGRGGEEGGGGVRWGGEIK